MRLNKWTSNSKYLNKEEWNNIQSCNIIKVPETNGSLFVKRCLTGKKMLPHHVDKLCCIALRISKNISAETICREIRCFPKCNKQEENTECQAMSYTALPLLRITLSTETAFPFFFFPTAAGPPAWIVVCWEDRWKFGSACVVSFYVNYFFCSECIHRNQMRYPAFCMMEAFLWCFCFSYWSNKWSKPTVISFGKLMLLALQQPLIAEPSTLGFVPNIVLQVFQKTWQKLHYTF